MKKMRKERKLGTAQKWKRRERKTTGWSERKKKKEKKEERKEKEEKEKEKKRKTKIISLGP
jgi:hypothetical protein